jgi:hypothetical protein
VVGVVVAIVVAVVAAVAAVLNTGMERLGTGMETPKGERPTWL